MNDDISTRASGLDTMVDKNRWIASGGAEIT